MMIIMVISTINSKIPTYGTHPLLRKTRSPQNQVASGIMQQQLLVTSQRHLKEWQAIKAHQILESQNLLLPRVSKEAKVLLPAATMTNHGFNQQPIRISQLQKLSSSIITQMAWVQIPI